MNVASLLHRTAGSWSAAGAVAVGSQLRWTYAELAHRVQTLAGYLVNKFGVEPGDRVALVMKNCVEYPEIMFAAWHAGAVVVPVNAKLHPREIQFILEHSAPRVCFTTSELTNAVATAQPHIEMLQWVITTSTLEYQMLFTADPIAMRHREPDDTAWIFYTSGTTGRPKGAMLTHRNLMAMTLNYLADVDSVTPGDAIIHAAPMSHGSGLYIPPQIAKGAIQVIPDSGGFDAVEICALFGSYAGITMFGAPTMLRRLLDCSQLQDADIANLKTFVYGGGPMYVADLKEALAVLGNKLVQIYGQGESPMTITCLSRAHHGDREHPRYEERLASVGVAFTGQRVRVEDVDDKSLQESEVGEVLVRGAVVMRGYWRNSDATAESLRSGWLHTGDLGALDEDGFLTLKDRSKDLIISGGANIYPREVEEVLLQHGAVHEVSVVGRPDPEWGEEVVAFVVRNRGATVTDMELEKLCLDNIARFKRPREYRYLEALPKNNYGKVLKTELRKLLQETDK